MILKTEGIVLKNFDFRETSKIAVFFTKEYGKVKGVLKGIRKDHRKFGSNVDKFSLNDIVYYQYRNSDLHLIGQCDLKAFFFPIRSDIKKTLAANYVLELVDAIMPAEEPNKEVYQMMMDYLASLETATDIDKLVHIFQVKILLLSGFRPHIDSCLICEKPVRDRARFSLQLGGLVCQDCKLNDPAAHAISKGAVASILHIENNDWQRSLRLGLSAAIKKELRYILNNFLIFHLERPLKTTKYLNAEK
ncbi:MAG TPA: DNA repair protein RecO [Candidatus Omnitrophota bacterium]|nr:DNA repair protein RecO [Candidatus Omnitrophota bacterium]HPD83868.1 DNA repair protein RecO [Candidatus Omnitrophota bacterium]HRZ02725.1 DNA repair protein RecO [Candidatus Omnitrophota bacterium]